MATYKSTVEWVDENHPFFVTPLINLGKPRMDLSISTAQIEDDYNGGFALAINPEFFEQYNEAECAGVLTHELYHVLMNHLAEFDKFENVKARQIAQECVVNDSVLEEGMALPDAELFYGMDWVQYNASFLPTKIVYDDLMKNPGKIPQKVELDCSHFDKGLNPREVFSQIFNNADIEKASESLKTILEDAASKAGSGFHFERRTATGKRISMKWTELINKIHPETFSTGGKSETRPDWSRPRRKLAGMRQRVMLPDKRDLGKSGVGGNKRPRIILALDTSGSIPRDKVQELLALAQSIPKRKVDVACCTFSTYYVPLDISRDIEEQDIAGGGTDFSAVREFVDSQSDSRDTHVIVITDGYAHFSHQWGYTNYPQNLDTNWHWLILDRMNMSDPMVKKNLYNYKEYVA